MATSVLDVVTAARDLNPLFTIERVPDKLLLRTLTRLERQLIAKGADVNPDEFITDNQGSEQAVSTNVLHQSGYTIPAALKYTDFYLNYTGVKRAKITILPAHLKGDPFINPSAYIQGLTLYPADPAGENWADETSRAGWTDASSIEWHYIAVPSTYTAVAGTSGTNPVTIPDHGVPALVDALGGWMAMRLANQVGQLAVQLLMGNARESEAAWLAQVDQFMENAVRYVHTEGQY